MGLKRSNSLREIIAPGETWSSNPCLYTIPVVVVQFMSIARISEFFTLTL
jgi:hypothetical protein